MSRMDKVAIFVEGQTEEIFVERLLLEIAGRQSICIETRRGYGGRRFPRKLITLKRETPRGDERYLALIVNCATDNRVKSDIRDNYESLVKSGYKAIIGIKDVYPDFKRQEIPKLEAGLRYKMKTRPVEVTFVLAVMEIEAWFLAEHEHFKRIHEGLTLARIRKAVGFDPSADDVELRDHPSDDLHRIYSLVGLAYNKRRGNVHRTVKVLDYSRMYLELGNRVSALGQFVGAIDTFLGDEQEAA